MIFADILKYKEAEAKLMRFGFRKVTDLEHPRMKYKGSMWRHPETKAIVNLYPDGSTTRESASLKDGWVNPMVELAKNSAKAAEIKAWESIIKLDEQLLDILNGTTNTVQAYKVIREVDQNLAVIKRVEKLRKTYKF